MAVELTPSVADSFQFRGEEEIVSENGGQMGV